MKLENEENMLKTLKTLINELNRPVPKWETLKKKLFVYIIVN